MASGKQRYRRLQVGNVWVRTAFEIVAIIFAITFCCVTIVSAYEETYSEATLRNTMDYSMQLGDSISGLVAHDAVTQTDGERYDYLAARCADDLDSCFISENTLNSGAVYVMKNGDPSLYAASRQYLAAMIECGLVDGETGAPGEDLDSALRAAFAGGESVLGQEGVCVSLSPSLDEDSGLPYAVTAVSVTFRDSFEYDSAVRSRVILISVVVCLLIVAYYLASAMITEKNRIKEKAVNEL